MSPDERRAMIVHTALPLIAELGASVTTGQIARAAGIGEATVFRAFTDKDELLGACVAEALRTDHVLSEIASITLEQPLNARLIDAATAMRAYLERMGAIVGALHASGHLRRTGPEERAHDGGDRAASVAGTRDALVPLFEPERESLRLAPERLAALFIGLLFTRPRVSADDQPELSVEEMIDVFLNGAVTSADGAG